MQAPTFTSKGLCKCFHRRRLVALGVDPVEQTTLLPANPATSLAGRFGHVEWQLFTRQSTKYPAHAVCRWSSVRDCKQRHTACAGYGSRHDRLPLVLEVWTVDGRSGSAKAAGRHGFFSSGLGGFLPYFASYSAANLASSFGLQRKHCDSGRLCSLHQSPFCWYSAATFALHCAQMSSGTPCSVHQPATAQASAAGVAALLPSGPFAPAPPQPPSANPVVASNENEAQSHPS